MRDLISRQAAIEALMVRDKELRNINWYDKPYAEGECKGIDYALEIVNALPSAQPDVPDTNVGDMISRRMAINGKISIQRANGAEVWSDEAVPIEYLKRLPPAQPEPLTDKEQRLFLAAMGREEKVCKQVDDECRDCREPYEDSLVKTCHEITRKVKGALWTI